MNMYWSLALASHVLAKTLDLFIAVWMLVCPQCEKIPLGQGALLMQNLLEILTVDVIAGVTRTRDGQR